MHKGSLFSTSSPTLVICHLFQDSQSNRCEVTISLWFDWHFPDDWWCWAHFHVPVGHFTNRNMKQIRLPSLEKCLFLFWPFACLLIRLLLLFLLFVWLIYICWILVPYQIWFANMSSLPFGRLSFHFTGCSFCCINHTFITEPSTLTPILLIPIFIFSLLHLTLSYSI